MLFHFESKNNDHEFGEMSSVAVSTYPCIVNNIDNNIDQTQVYPGETITIGLTAYVLNGSPTYAHFPPGFICSSENKACVCSSFLKWYGITQCIIDSSAVNIPSQLWLGIVDKGTIVGLLTIVLLDTVYQRQLSI